jgi:hypothetical protein
MERDPAPATASDCLSGTSAGCLRASTPDEVFWPLLDAWRSLLEEGHEGLLENPFLAYF